MTEHKIPTIAYLSTFPPRACGIATFTADLVASIDDLFYPSIHSEIIAMQSAGQKKLNYGSKVTRQIREQIPADYKEAARFLNSRPEIKLVSIQHEFGIFGENRGINLLAFLKAIKKPVVVTFHTVLPDPDPELSRRVKSIAAACSKIVVMTTLSAQILHEYYRIPSSKIALIAHGIHHVEYSLPGEHKKRLGLPERSRVLSSFGLLNSGKGLEYVLQALPSVVKKFPNILYLIIGATHPEVLRREGEIYRRSLEELVRKLGLQKYVRFYNRYVKLDELLEYLQATDLYVSASLDPNQAVSGTLSYALGAGRPVLSTRFAQARSVITPEVGALVGFRDPGDIARTVSSLLHNSGELTQMGRTAYFRTRNMTWGNTALAYMRLFSKIAPQLSEKNYHLPPVKLDHLARLTGPHGVFQFARLNVADPKSGYTLDDNARALMAAARLYAKDGNRQALALAGTYLNFMVRSAEKNGTFRNYFDQHMRRDHFMERKDNQEDSRARALRALMEISASSALPSDFRDKASRLLTAAMRAGINFVHPRAIAFYVLGLREAYRKNPSHELREEAGRYAGQLVSLYRENHTSSWRWFEKKLTYSNSILSEALIAGYEITGSRSLLSLAKTTLNFLIAKTFEGGVYMPIGQNGWYFHRGQRSYFDQQPEDVAAMVQTLARMYEVTGEEKYSHLRDKAFLWFLGENPLGQFVYDLVSGGCYDGLGEKSINLNQGAESTISYLLARLVFEHDRVRIKPQDGEGTEAPGKKKKRARA